jgi:hypothetical protein
MATTKTELYNNGTLVATKTSAPFNTFDWTPASGEVGSASLTVKRYEDGVLVATSAAVGGTVDAASGVPSYTADALTAPYMSAINVTDDTTVYFSGTPQEITGEKFTYDIDLLIKDLKTATSVSDLSTVFSAIYPRFGDSYDRIKYNLINPVDTDAGKRLTYAGNHLYNPEGVRSSASNPLSGVYWNTYVNPLDHASEAYGVITSIASDNTVPGNRHTLVTQTSTSGKESMAIHIVPGREINVTVNAQSVTGLLVGQSLMGVYGVIRNGADSAFYKNGVKITNVSNGPYGTGKGDTTFTGGEFRNSSNSDAAITYSTSNQTHLTEAYFKTALTEAQMIAVSNAISDFEGRINRKTW